MAGSGGGSGRSSALSNDCSARKRTPRDLVSQLVPRPLLVFASEKDKVVPSPLARASFEAAQARKGMFVFPNA